MVELNMPSMEEKLQETLQALHYQGSVMIKRVKVAMI
jgi:hypothetical protein